MSLPAFLPESAHVVLQSVDASPTVTRVALRATAPAASCPVCQQPSDRVHSRYVRTLTDLPWHGQVVQIRLEVRRFFCRTPHCQRRIFSERLSFAVAFARTTQRLNGAHTKIGLSLGGEPGARLALQLAMPTSPDTLLRRIRQAPSAAAQPVRVRGVDDWAFRRGQHYGTILVDLERRCPVDLLPERSAAALAQWLQTHPEVEIISRDRADDYIKGAKDGAPQAVQVADRWHLLRNLRDAMRRVVDRLQGKIRQAVESAVPVVSTAPPIISQLAEDAPKPQRPTRYRQRQEERRQRRLDMYQQVQELDRQGLSHREIGRRLGLNRATVRRFARAEAFPERAPRRVPRRTDSVVEFMRRRWQQGCCNAARLWNELKTEGFTGSYYMVRRRLAGWRRQARDAMPTTEGPPASLRRFSARQVVWLLLRSETELDDAERASRASVEQQDAELQQAATLGRQFREIVREHRAADWDRWLAQAQEETMTAELRAFAHGLQADESAVRAALASPWSNGQVEGQVNRLKTLKRQMYGRAKFDLLRKRFLPCL